MLIRYNTLHTTSNQDIISLQQDPTLSNTKYPRKHTTHNISTI